MQFELSQDRETWYPAVVPGGVHESLLAAGVIDHPYFGDNEQQVRWVEEVTWWYRTQLDVEPPAEHERVVLVLPSVDTVADVFLDGQLIASHANAFRPLEVEVASGELLLRFSPPLQDLAAPVGAQLTADLMKAFFASEMGPDEKPHEDPPGVLSADLALTRRRKPTFSWGWDFGPRVPSIGLLQEPYVRRDRVATADWHVRTLHVDVDKAIAQVGVDVEVDAFGTRGPLSATVTLESPTGRRTSVELPLPGLASNRRASAVVPVHEAELWWTHDLGTPALYDVTLTVTEGSSTLLRERLRTGLRTVVLDRSPDPEQPGRCFRFLLNDVPTYSRGANWVPPSTLRGSVTTEQVRRLVGTARRGNMTMLRVWGGGTYEQDAFYDACDELGILVWQDFMFACIDYPSEERALQDEVAREADFQVRRLRNHPCLALWCGNNEVHGIHRAVYSTLEPNDWGWHFFHGILPDTVSRLSPGTAYWPGSPWADDDPRGTNGVHDGDRHAWEVWHGMDIGAGGPTEFASKGERVHWSRYAHDLGRFISEFGIHASPEQPTLERWTPPGSLSLRSGAFDGRNKDLPKDKGWALMAHETGEPTTLTEYVDFSMACQAEGLKFGVEHYRRRQPHNNGTLVWQLNDVWPGFSWSVIDYDLVPKAGFYTLQRAYQTVLASFRVHDDRLELWVTNSGLEHVDLTLVVEVLTFGGESVVEEKLQVASPPYSSVAVWTSDVARTPDRFAWVSGDVEPNRLFFAPLRELPLDGQLIVSARRDEVTLTARGFCYAARVVTPVPGVVCDTNYVDLRDGESRTIRLSGLPDGFDMRTLEVRTYGGAPVPVH